MSDMPTRLVRGCRLRQCSGTAATRHRLAMYLNKLVDKAPDHRDEYTSLQSVSRMIDLTSGRGAYLEKCAGMFDRVLQLKTQITCSTLRHRWAKQPIWKRRISFGLRSGIAK